MKVDGFFCEFYFLVICRLLVVEFGVVVVVVLIIYGILFVVCGVDF